MMIGVRNDVLSVTGGKQVPWDHSSLTGDFYFSRDGAPEQVSKSRAKPDADETARLEQRIRELEEQLQEKTSAADMAMAVRLAQLRERVRTISEDMKLDMQTIFRLQREGFKVTDQREKAKLRAEVSRLHLRMARKGQERKKLNELIAGLEKKVSLEE